MLRPWLLVGRSWVKHRQFFPEHRLKVPTPTLLSCLPCLVPLLWSVSCRRRVNSCCAGLQVAMSEIKAATSAYQLYQREKHAEIKASLEVGALS